MSKERSKFPKFSSIEVGIPVIVKFQEKHISSASRVVIERACLKIKSIRRLKAQSMPKISKTKIALKKTCNWCKNVKHHYCDTSESEKSISLLESGDLAHILNKEVPLQLNDRKNLVTARDIIVNCLDRVWGCGGRSACSSC